MCKLIIESRLLPSFNLRFIVHVERCVSELSKGAVITFNGQLTAIKCHCKRSLQFYTPLEIFGEIFNKFW